MLFFLFQIFAVLTCQEVTKKIKICNLIKLSQSQDIEKNFVMSTQHPFFLKLCKEFQNSEEVIYYPLLTQNLLTSTDAITKMNDILQNDIEENTAKKIGDLKKIKLDKEKVDNFANLIRSKIKNYNDFEEAIKSKFDEVAFTISRKNEGDITPDQFMCEILDVMSKHIQITEN